MGDSPQKLMTHRFIIRRNGTLRYLEQPPFVVPGPKFRKRFSHIRPVSPLLRAAFMLLRLCFGDKGEVAEWTRRWACRWRMTVIHSGFTAESTSRQELLDLEREKFFEPIGDII